MRDLTGTHDAVCYMAADLGTHPIDRGVHVFYAREIRFGFELPDVLNREGLRWRIQRSFPWKATQRASLRRALETWAGRALPDALDPFAFVSLSARVTLSRYELRTGQVLHRIDEIAPPQVVHAPLAPLIRLSLEPHAFEAEAFHRLPERLQDRVKASPEWEALIGPAPLLPGEAAANAEPDFIPF